mmetsp:Transcript_26573/g.53331  ORF Transcript_26573/g.53331 Transcript_26573/m.53331 type:complete len:144 (-) Transcript_26573:940-1371(-)
MAFITLPILIKKYPKQQKTDENRWLKNKKIYLVFMNSENTSERKEISDEKSSLEVKIPGKITLSDTEILKREKKLRLLSEQWKKERIEKEELERKLFGFTKNSEILNGRFAMFFLTTGLLTELWTKQSIISQIDTIIRTLGFL